MTLAQLPRFREYLADGVTTEFPIPFQFFDITDIEIYTRAAGATGDTIVSTGRTIAGGSGDTGTCTFAIAPGVAVGVVGVRARTPIKQSDEYPNGGNFPSLTVERGYDRAAAIDQEQQDQIDDHDARAIMAPRGEAGLTLAPAASSKAPYRVFGRDPVTGLPAEIDLPASFKGDPGGNVMAIGLFSAASALNVPIGTDVVRTSGHAAVARGFGDYAAFDLGSQAANDAYVAANPLTAFKSANGRYFGLAAVEPSAEMLGAVGDGATDDRDALNAALAQGVGGKLTMPRNYSVSAGPPNPNQALPDPNPSALTITKSDFVLDGLGMAAIACASANKGLIHVLNASEANRPRRGTIRNFRKLTQAYGNPEFGGLNDDYFTVRLEGAYDWLVENLHIDQCELGFTDQFGETYNYCKYLTFDAATDVSTADNTITLDKDVLGAATTHDFVTGSRVAMNPSGTTVWGLGATMPGGLNAPYRYYAIVIDATTIKLAATLDDAMAGTAVDLTAIGDGTVTMMRMERGSKRNTLKNFSIERCAYMGIQLGSCAEGFYEGQITGQDSDGYSRGGTHALRSDGFWFAPTERNRARVIAKRMANGLSLQTFSEHNTYSITATDCVDGVSSVRPSDYIAAQKHNEIEINATDCDYGIYEDGGSFNTYVVDILNPRIRGIIASNGGGGTGLATGNRYAGIVRRSLPGNTQRLADLSGPNTTIDLILIGSGSTSADTLYGLVSAGADLHGSVAVNKCQNGIVLSGSGANLSVKVTNCASSLVVSGNGNKVSGTCDGPVTITGTGNDVKDIAGCDVAGVASGTTDASGQLVVTHGMKGKPSAILFEKMAGTTRTCEAPGSGRSATAFTIVVRDSANALVTNTAVAVAWRANL